jgi:superfamily II DNA or RNA helicase
MTNTAKERVGDVQDRARHACAARFVGQNLFDDLTSFAGLEARIAALATEKERGDAFEVFAEAYLATQKIHQAAEVWPENSAPIAVMQKLALPDTDQGVDGVLKQFDGALAAYQVKFRTGRPTLAWRDLSTFIGLADRVAHRILFTNCDEVADVLNERRDFICVRGADLDSLTKHDLNTIATWLRGDDFKPVLKTPREHQQNALTDLERGLAANDRATAVMACGSGKTLVALWLAERMETKRILVLVPSLSLIRQTLHEWLKETRWDAPRFLACCSDPSVTSGVDDAIVMRPSDLDFPVTTDASEVRDFLKADDAQVRVVFSTYQSAQVVGEAIQGLPGFELGVFDEAHKTAGRTELKFAFALEDKNIPIAKRVFMTATPRHYDVRKKDKEGDAALVYSMDEPQAYGPIVHTLTFTEAVRRGIICDCKIIISVVTSDMLDEELLRRGDVIVEGDAVRARTVANQVALQKACEAHDLKKLFTFHSTVKSAADFTGAASSSVRAHLPGYEALHVNGALPTARREKVMQAFREADRAVLSNARCLTEGVDVPAVDLVAFLSPRKSKVDIVQAAGRAMRKSGDKQTGYVLLPLFLETAKDESIEDALERTDFAEAWDVIQALREQDEVLADVIRQMREERGHRGGFDDTRLRERIEVLGPQVSLDLIRAAVSAQVVEQFGVTWDERFGELVAFKEREGHCNVPVRRFATNPKLGIWVGTQRRLAKEGKLEAERKAKMDALGFEWDPFDVGWEEMFAKLVAFKGERGHCDVPQKYSPDQKLASWLNTQRTWRRKGKLPPSREARLSALGVSWDPVDDAWQAQYQALREYHSKCGHADVPESERLGEWLSHQRALRRREKLSPQRLALLDELNVSWDPVKEAWEEMFASLRRYRHANGHCDVPQQFREEEAHAALGLWVGAQRHRKGRLSKEQIRRLDELGFVWTAREDRWQQMFNALSGYRQSLGHFGLSQEDEPKLYRWMVTQREFFRKGVLAADRVAKLNALGFPWNSRDDRWEQMFAQLVAFKQANGSCRVPSNGRNADDLGRWVSKQRSRFERISQERKARLDALGFEWEPLASVWEEMFAALIAFKADHGHCDVPQRWKANKPLATWVAVQRRNKVSITKERRDRLDALGFDWGRQTTQWERMYAELAAYKAKNGDCNVPKSWVEDQTLFNWVQWQRQQFRKRQISPERKARLDALGFEWSRRD